MEEAKSAGGKAPVIDVTDNVSSNPGGMSGDIL